MSNANIPPPPPPPPPPPLLAVAPPRPPPSGRPWHRLPLETDAAWRAFALFLEQGSPDAAGLPRPRSITATARALGHRSHGQVSEWAKDFRWHDRVAAYDRHLRSVQESATEDELEALAGRRARIASKVLAVVEEEVDRLRGLQLEGHPVIDELRHLPHILKEAANLERLEEGKSTANVAVAGVEWDLSKLSVEELQALADIRDKAGGSG